MLYQMKSESTLNLLTLGKILARFQTEDLPRLNKYYNYYKGKQAILSKSSTDPVKKYNKIVVNYCEGVVKNYSGYLTGVDIDYSSEGNIDAILNVLNYNDVHSADTDLLLDALTFGRGVELNYIDEEGQQRFKTIDPRTCIDIYDDTLEQKLLYGVRFYQEDLQEDNQTSYIVEVYDAKSVKTYRSNAGFSSFTLLEEREHFYQQVPITFFDLNKEQTSIFHSIMSLNDAYNSILSGECDAWDAFADSYLILKGLVADEQDLEKMREARLLIMDGDASAEYLTKDINTTQVNELLSNLNDQIHKIALSPDFNDEKFMAQSGISMRYKLIGFTNQAGLIEARMRKALQKRIELICAIENLKDEATWRDIDIQFTYNLPEDVNEKIAEIQALSGIVSRETLLEQLPFIADPKAEMKRLEEERATFMTAYNFDEVLGQTEE